VVWRCWSKQGSRRPASRRHSPSARYWRLRSSFGPRRSFRLEATAPLAVVIACPRSRRADCGRLDARRVDVLLSGSMVTTERYVRRRGNGRPLRAQAPRTRSSPPPRAGRRQVLRRKCEAAARPECAGSRRKTVVLISTSGCTPPVEPTTLRPTNRSTASMSGWRRASSSTCLCCITAPVLPYARSVRSPFVKPPWSTQTTRSSPMYVRALRGPCPMCSLCRRTIEREISQSSSARSGRDEAGCTLPAFVEVGTRPDTDGTIAQ
jgi:hypothetical protein